MPEKNRMLIVRPDRDAGLGANYYGFYWLAPVLEDAQRLGITIVDLERDYAVLKYFKPSLEKYNPIFVFGFGHGNEEVFTGQDYDLILEACSNDQLLKDRVVYLLSCQTATVLGHSIIEKGGLSFIGYKEDFVFISETPAPSNPLNDSFTRAFFEPALEIVYSLIRGHSTGQAYKNSQTLFDEWIEYWSKQSSEEAPFIIQGLLWDKNNQVLIGSDSQIIAVPNIQNNLGMALLSVGTSAIFLL